MLTGDIDGKVFKLEKQAKNIVFFRQNRPFFDGNDLLFIAYKCIWTFFIQSHSLIMEGILMSRKPRHPFRAMALMSIILSQLAGSMLIGLFFGKWLDGQVGTEPLFLVLGLLMGLGTGIYAMLRSVRQFFSGE
jgi:ATP synthase protein I